MNMNIQKKLTNIFIRTEWVDMFEPSTKINNYIGILNPIEDIMIPIILLYDDAFEENRKSFLTFV